MTFLCLPGMQEATAVPVHALHNPGKCSFSGAARICAGHPVNAGRAGRVGRHPPVAGVDCLCTTAFARLPALAAAGKTLLH